jgi:hypothetical protein
MESAHEKMNDTPTMTMGLQCCLLCGRTLTNRELHDAVEEQVIETIRSEHPEWTEENGTCKSCVVHYRDLINNRLSRAERLEVRDSRLWARLFNRIRRPGSRD